MLHIENPSCARQCGPEEVVNIVWRNEPAARLAAIGWPIFPIPARRKKPVIKWGTAASSAWDDWLPRVVRLPRTNWGAAMGAEAGVWCLDIDGDHGRRSLSELVECNGALPDAPTQVTGGGGQHVFFAWPEDREVRNSASRIAPKIDVRGAGGFVVVPPSIHPNGNTYRWIEDCSPWQLAPPSAPRWLLDLVAPLPKPPPPMQAPVVASGRYAVAALRSAVARVGNAAEGGRNATLNAEAFGTARFVLDGELAEGVWRAALAEAAAHAGLGAREIDATLASALRGRLEAPW